MSNISNLMYNALEKKYESEILQAKTTLTIYFKNSVGIGEHPQHLEEMDKLLASIADSEDKLEMLRKHFNIYSESSHVRASP